MSYHNHYKVYNTTVKGRQPNIIPEDDLRQIFG
jgi:hypothetical protein